LKIADKYLTEINQARSREEVPETMIWKKSAASVMRGNNRAFGQGPSAYINLKIFLRAFGRAEIACPTGTRKPAPSTNFNEIQPSSTFFNARFQP